MDDRLLLGMWRCVLPIPPKIWQRVVNGDQVDLEFMSVDHHRVRNLVVEALPRQGEALRPEWISATLDLPILNVVKILEELERKMTFLYRNSNGAVTWAYPVTVDKTTHNIIFSSGEKIYAA